MRSQLRERCRNRKSVAAAIVACTALFAGQALYSNAQTATVTLSPGANIQSAVAANPSGTTFILQPGVYRMQSVIPKDGDVFIGQTGADLNGSQVLTNWVRSGSYWTSTGAPALNTPFGPASEYCADATTGCAYPQDLYLNNKPLVHKLSLPITSGQWYFDYTNDVIYMADNPAGQTVELSVTKQAFRGYVNNVKVQNLVVEKYAVPLLLGAISPYGSNWIINFNGVRLNHGAGIKAGSGQPGADYEIIWNNSVHDNGEEGIAVCCGTGTLVAYNTISNNDFAYVLSEFGGGKIAGTTNAQVINNTYTNNNGVGLWGDVHATGTIFSGNTVTGSQLEGIRYEISHYGTISNNTLRYNGQYQGSGACNAGREIHLAASDHTTVFGNQITSNCSGIQIDQDSRNAAVYDSVTDNVTTYPGSTRLFFRIGGKDPLKPSTLFDPASHNYFDYNTYHFSSPSMLTLQNWIWAGTAGPNSPLNWSDWQAAGEDIHGTAD